MSMAFWKFRGWVNRTGVRSIKREEVVGALRDVLNETDAEWVVVLLVVLEKRLKRRPSDGRNDYLSKRYILSRLRAVVTKGSSALTSYQLEEYRERTGIGGGG